MLDWLTRDPLNGLIITVTFFISMIIGRILREKMDIKVGKRDRKIDPRIKLAVSFLLIIAATLMMRWYFLLVISILCIVIALKLHRLQEYCKKLIFPLVLALFIFAVQSFTYGVTKIELGIIQVYAEGVEYGFLIFTRVFASASVLMLLILTTSINDILESMRWFRVPGTIIEISSFMTRYIKTFSYEGKRLKLAQESRCGLSGSLNFTDRMYNVASICGALITRAFTRSEEVYRAMLSRAWKPGLRYPVDAPPLNKKDMILGVAFVSGIIGLVWIDRFL